MSNSSKDGDVGTGFHFWLVRKLWTDRNGWPGNLFAVILSNGDFEFVVDSMTATKFKTRDDAEKAAFDITIKSPEHIGKVTVELL